MGPEDGPIEVALHEPEIPGNAGSVARLCAAAGAPLHLIGRLGFSLSHPAARRAGMDYWKMVRLHRHISLNDFQRATAERPCWLFSTGGKRELWDAAFAPGDILLFGSESQGLPERLLADSPDHVLRIPMLRDARSLNLATSAAIGLYEALRCVRSSMGAAGVSRTALQGARP